MCVFNTFSEGRKANTNRGWMTGNPSLIGGRKVADELHRGMLLSIGLIRSMATWVGDATAQPLMVGSVIGLLLLVAAAACLVPARRAVVIDPMIALRRE
jgi:hypothetical protein